MRFAKAFLEAIVVTVMATTHIYAQGTPNDFLNALISATGTWNNLTFTSSGPMTLTGEINTQTNTFSTDVSTAGAFGLPDSTYHIEGTFALLGDSLVIAVLLPWPGALVVKEDTVYGSFAVSIPPYYILLEINGTYTDTSANFTYNMSGSFVANGTADLHYVALTSVESLISVRPAGYHLGQNYPNPFNPNTLIPFSMNEPGLVKISVHDILGREVAVLINERLGAGEYRIPFQARTLVSGIYFYRIQTSKYQAVRRMMLME